MARYTSGPEWGRYLQETDPTRRVTDAFLTSFKEGMAYKLAQEDEKREEQRKAREQKAMEDYQNLQMAVKAAEMKQQQEQQQLANYYKQQAEKRAAGAYEMDKELHDRILAGEIDPATASLIQQRQASAWATGERAKLTKAQREKLEGEEPEEAKLPTGIESTKAVTFMNQLKNAQTQEDLDRVYKQAGLHKNEFGKWSTDAKGKRKWSASDDFNKLTNYYHERSKELGGDGTAPEFSYDQQLVMAWRQARDEGSNALFHELGDPQKVYNDLVKRYGKENVDKVFKQYK